MKLARTSLALAVVATAALGSTHSASARIDPSASAVLAGALKPAMQAKLKKAVRGLVVTKVTCYVSTTSKLVSGPCTARFTVARVHLDGVYRAKATLDNRSRLSWSTSAVTCTDSRTHKRVAC